MTQPTLPQLPDPPKPDHSFDNMSMDEGMWGVDKMKAYATTYAKLAVNEVKRFDMPGLLMAQCMVEVRADLIAAGVIASTVPPMMVAEAVCSAIHRLRCGTVDELGVEAEIQAGWSRARVHARSLSKQLQPEKYEALLLEREALVLLMFPDPYKGKVALAPDQEERLEYLRWILDEISAAKTKSMEA